MHAYQVHELIGSGIWLVFAFAFGACAGSLINVLVYRLPLGIGVVTPPSRCPTCDTRLTWRENIPVFGWLRLRGRCRFCRSKISPEYPLVEALVGLLFVLFFVLWYTVPQEAHWLGINWGAIRPEWARNDLWTGWPRQTWPEFVVLVVLIGALTAMTLVDAKTFTIPLELPWAATVVGVVFHTGHALYLDLTTGKTLRFTAPGFVWAIPTPMGDVPTRIGWWWIGASIGAVVGLGLGVLFLRQGWLRRSFADYPAWEAEQLAAAAKDAAPAGVDCPLRLVEAPRPAARSEPPSSNSAGRVLKFVVALIGAVVIVTTLASFAASPLGLPRWSGIAAGLVIGPLLASAATRRREPNPDPGEATEDPSAMWIQYPHARREMWFELLFLAPCLFLGWMGGLLATHLAAGPAGTYAEAPLWLNVLAGTLMGYLIGGGVVWAMRIAGSLGFGKEAMGLGDVHLLAAVGACIGWIDAALAFPLAAVVGLFWYVIGLVGGNRAARSMPFGPYLAVAAVLVILGKPLIEMGLTNLLAIPPGEPPVNLP